MKGLGERLKKARKDLGYTQQQVADLILLNRTTITNYELENNEPDLNTIVKLAELYEVTCDWILGKKISTKTKEN